MCDDSGRPRYPGSGEYRRLRGGKPILQELLSLFHIAWHYSENSVVSQRLSGRRDAFGQFDRGTPGAIQIHLEKSGNPRPSCGGDPAAARPIVHESISSESQMRLDQGETKSYSLSYYHDELAVIDTSAPDFDQVISIPDSQLYKGHKIGLPVDSLEVGIDEYFINSALFRPDQLPSSNYPHLPVGPMAVSVQTERTYKENERNMPTAAVSVWQGGRHVASWNLAAGFPRPVSFQAGGKNYQIVLRPKRFYKPFAIQLVQFSHDRYAGTDLPKNFSSRIRLLDPSRHEDRETLIYMNHPLRYEAMTFYQSGFDNNDTTTILQVVQNPSL